MKQLQEIENNVKAARSRLNKFLVDVQCHMERHMEGCVCRNKKECYECKCSNVLIAKAQKMLDDE